jgi:hypothetical protein
VLKLCQTGRVWASRPAKKGGRSVKGKKNSNANVMYICVSMCHVALLCCWNKQQDTGWAIANKKYIQRGRPKGGSVLAWIEAMKDIFTRCFKTMAVQVCTSHKHVFLPVQLPCVLLVCLAIILYPGVDLHY